MRMLRKAAVVVAALGSIGLIGAGTAHAGGEKEGRKDGTHFDIKQGTSCRSHDLNVEVLGTIGILDGALGNALGGEGAPGTQQTKIGSSLGCNNAAGK
ncbi:hypothetical protein SSP35_23_00680 [Streptomyces sp. NBRC 110611]|uniref:hypothetical protein n=1 Tax=Streptomyces sp. NBRC 110611 TaxID=1621259 RepID=UPI00083515A4|nr:hypothetical protein [Streptomyces sp. NBRC 110611]GAU70878.1 hypothetical protein SSP35_23_00680 [Streptomyces sp. NBRC 110611]